MILVVSTLHLSKPYVGPYYGVKQQATLSIMHVINFSRDNSTRLHHGVLNKILSFMPTIPKAVSAGLGATLWV